MRNRVLGKSSPGLKKLLEEQQVRQWQVVYKFSQC